MDNMMKLELVALANISAPDAMDTIAASLKEGTELSARRVYNALRSWIWKTLEARRRDEELRDWYDLLRRVSAAMASDYPILASQVQTLHELLYESVSVSETHSIERVTAKKHVALVLSLIGRSPGGIVEREEVGSKLNLNQSNLTRVLNLVSVAGLVEKKVVGRKVLLQLSRNGQSALADIADDDYFHGQVADLGAVSLQDEPRTVSKAAIAQNGLVLERHHARTVVREHAIAYYVPHRVTFTFADAVSQVLRTYETGVLAPRRTLDYVEQINSVAVIGGKR